MLLVNIIVGGCEVVKMEVMIDEVVVTGPKCAAHLEFSKRAAISERQFL